MALALVYLDAPAYSGLENERHCIAVMTGCRLVHNCSSATLLVTREER